MAYARRKGGLPETRVLHFDDERRMGQEGEEQWVELELKTIADVGLVGTHRMCCHSKHVPVPASFFLF